ncbi:hypothetical protein ABZP36_029422 [Zizania latifolia]
MESGRSMQEQVDRERGEHAAAAASSFHLSPWLLSSYLSSSLSLCRREGVDRCSLAAVCSLSSVNLAAMYATTSQNHQQDSEGDRKPAAGVGEERRELRTQNLPPELEKKEGAQICVFLEIRRNWWCVAMPYPDAYRII